MCKVFVPDLNDLPLNFFLLLKKDPESDCWLWDQTSKYGFGVIIINDTLQSIYHFVYKAFKGVEFKGKNIVKTCNEKLCCNPKHFDLVPFTLPKGNWVPSPDLPLHFWVSDKGELFSTRTNRLLKLKIINCYLGLTTRINGELAFLRSHTEVAKAFVPNPNKKPFVNHINGIKICNEAYNLEWVTGKENSLHAKAMGLLKPGSRLSLLGMDYQTAIEILKHPKMSRRKAAKVFKVGARSITTLRNNTKRYLALLKKKDKLGIKNFKQKKH